MGVLFIGQAIFKRLKKMVSQASTEKILKCKCCYEC